MMRRVFFIILAVAVILSGCNERTKKAEAADDVLNNEAAEENEPAALPLEGKIIVIDAGHGKNSYNKEEKIAPDSDETKIAFASGTAGKNQTEEELNLSVALILQKSLEDLGAKVHMTRTAHESDMTNIDRAEFANELGADISVKIHADGSNDGSVHGVSVLVPGSKHISDGELLSESKKAGELVLEGFVDATGAYNRGISVRDDLTGFNWTKVPIILVEMGFMTNPDEDALMESPEYQEKMAGGIARGLLRYFENADDI